MNGGELAVALDADGRGWKLPTTAWSGRPALIDSVARVTKARFAARATWSELATASAGNGDRHGADLSLVYAAAVPSDAVARTTTWHPIAHLPQRVVARHRVAIDAAIAHIARRADQSEVAFHLLPRTFTLSELQRVYERLLGRPLHKASFRRALHNAHLVKALDEWRMEGRGRPAQLFVYAPRRQRNARAGLRLDTLIRD